MEDRCDACLRQGVVSEGVGNPGSWAVGKGSVGVGSGVGGSVKALTPTWYDLFSSFCGCWRRASDQ